MTTTLGFATEPAAAPDLGSDVVRPPGFPAVDLRLIQLVVENAANAVEDDVCAGEPGSTDADAALVEQIGLLESIGHTVAAMQATLTRRFARRHVATQIEKRARPTPTSSSALWPRRSGWRAGCRRPWLACGCGRRGICMTV